MFGETIDISEYLDFGFYDQVWYHENAGLGEVKLSCWLGVTHHVGSQMCYHVLTQNRTVIARSSVQRVTNVEADTEANKQLFSTFDAEITCRLCTGDLPVDGDKPDPVLWADIMENDDDFHEEFQKVHSDPQTPDADQSTPEIMDDTYINTQLSLPHDADGPTFATVGRRIRDADDNPIGTAHQNPILDT